MNLLDVLVSTAIFTTAIVPMLYLAATGQRLARVTPDATDLHQRVRVVSDKLQRDIAQAGASSLHGSLARGLSAFVPPVLPARTGLRSPDPELSAFSDRISVIAVPDGGTLSLVASSMIRPSDGLRLDTSARGCPASGLCGFANGIRALVFDPGGTGLGYDLFTVTSATTELAHDAPNPAFSKAYPAGTMVVPIVQRVYSFDRVNRRIVMYDGFQSEMPLIDNVVDLTFQYFGDADGDDGVRPVPLAQLSDGPVVGISPNAFDRDLLRLRFVRVTLRLRSSDDVTDYATTFDVKLRNMVKE
jgi:hypothetical protein